jgi:hypothetical protein
MRRGRTPRERIGELGSESNYIISLHILRSVVRTLRSNDELRL